MTKKEDNDQSGMLIPAGVLIGLGVGFIVDELVGGLLVGLGVGFAVSALLRIFMTKRS